MKKENTFNIFMREKPCFVFIVLYYAESYMYASQISKKIDCTYAHVVNILNIMKSKGYVKFKRKGRIILISLTLKGRLVADHIVELNNLL